MAYSVKYKSAEVRREQQMMSRKIFLFEWANISADTMEELGQAIDEVEKKYPKSCRMRPPGSSSSFWDGWAHRNDGNLAAAPADERVTPRREKGKWKITWGRWKNTGKSWSP
jgi:hypothetical protein